MITVPQRAEALIHIVPQQLRLTASFASPYSSTSNIASSSLSNIRRLNLLTERYIDIKALMTSILKRLGNTAQVQQ
jgi:hypothetical protein